MGRSCADAKMMTTSSFTESTLTLTSTPPSECFNIDDEILIWNQANGVHYFRTVASLTSNVITIKGGEGIDVEKLESSDSLLVQRVPNYNKLTVVSGSKLTHAAYGTNEYGGVLAFRVFTSLVVQEGGVIDMHEKGYRGGTSGSADGLEYYGGRKSDGGMLFSLFSLSFFVSSTPTRKYAGGTGGHGGGAHQCGNNRAGYDGTNGAGGGGGGGGGHDGGSCTSPCRGGGGGAGGGNGNGAYGGYGGAGYRRMDFEALITGLVVAICCSAGGGGGGGAAFVGFSERPMEDDKDKWFFGRRSYCWSWWGSSMFGPKWVQWWKSVQWFER